MSPASARRPSSRSPSPDVLPCFSAVQGRDAERRVRLGPARPSTGSTEGIKTAKEGESIVIANLAGFTPEEAAELAAKAAAAGADMIEIPTHCPHMGEILMAMYPGLEMPEPKLADVAPMQRTVSPGEAGGEGARGGQAVGNLLAHRHASGRAG